MEKYHHIKGPIFTIIYLYAEELFYKKLIWNILEELTPILSTMDPNLPGTSVFSNEAYAALKK